MGDAEFFIGMKFDWLIHPDGHINCHLSQEAYANVIADSMGLTDAVVSPQMTPFRSGFPIDAIPSKDMTDSERAPLIAKMCSWCGMLNWLSIRTRLDITTVVSLFASCQCKPSPGHLEAAKYVGKYLKATASLGITFSSHHNSKLEAFVFFPVGNDRHPLTAFADANWGPQEASLPTDSSNLREFSLDETRSICGHIIFMCGSPIYWSSHKEKRTSGSSCKAEIKATNACTKSILMFRHVLSDLGLIDVSVPTPLYNDNQGAVNWSKTTSTKGMRHLNIQETTFMVQPIRQTYLLKNFNLMRRIIVFAMFCCVLPVANVALFLLAWMGRGCQSVCAG